jgi:flavin reductase (DIM6/NTAB) family NADH-FMN oxidoreductase RutF
MLHFDPKEISQREVHRLLIGGIGPRPIALVSTLSKDGIPNLTPFSFFNVFGSNPPIIAFSPSRRGRDSSLKDTYNNLMDTKECVVQVVTYSIAHQVNLASTEYPPEVDEFKKSGLTPINSDLVKPKRVKESPFQMECILREMRSFGEGGGSANIAICEVIKIHVEESVLKDDLIQPDLIDLVGRMGGSFYARANGNAIFKAVQPNYNLGIGYDNLPDFIKQSNVYSANNLGQFGTALSLPSEEEVRKFIKEIDNKIINDLEYTEESFQRCQQQNKYEKMLKVALSFKENPKKRKMLELSAKIALENDDLDFALKTAIYAGSI